MSFSPTPRPFLPKMSKRLPTAIRTSVVVARSVRSYADIETLDLVMAMIAAGCRKDFVCATTGYQPSVVNALWARDGASYGTGALATSLRPVLRYPQVHMAASEYLHYYSRLSADGALGGVIDLPPSRSGEPRQLCPRSMIRALQLVIGVHGRDALRWDQAAFISYEHHAGCVSLTTCGACSQVYLQSATAIQLHRTMSYGECPACRVLADLDSAGGPEARKIRSRAEARELMARLRAGGLATPPAEGRGGALPESDQDGALP